MAKGTGVVSVRGTTVQGALRLNCENNTHGQVLQGQPHSAAQSNYCVLPSGTGSQGSPDVLMSRTSTDTMTNKTLTAPTITSPLITTKVQASTNAADVTLNQYDATEVARIHDGGVVPTAAGTSTSLSAVTGFGFRRRVLTLGSGNDDNTLTLTAADSGSIIYVTPTNAVALILPLVGTETGQWFDIIFAANVNKTFSLKTSGQDAADNITLHCVASDAVHVDIGAANHDVLTITNAAVGTRIQVINAAGGDAEKWHAYVASMSTVDATIA